jgi:hypothetical protein
MSLIINTFETLQKELPNLESTVIIQDHMGGFDLNMHNPMLKLLNDYALANNRIYSVYQSYILTPEVKKNYPGLDLHYKSVHGHGNYFSSLVDYKIHPEIKYKNFLCSFNGSPHVSRKLLVSILNKFGFFNPEYSTKNMLFTATELDGHLTEWVYDKQKFYNCFFMNQDSFYPKIYTYNYSSIDHMKNIKSLENRLTKSFLHIVSESHATGYYPFYTEKFLYSIVTRGLFLSYAQPKWHEHLERYCGFRLYRNLFNYDFDAIINPVDRLIELMCMISKFSQLSQDDWHLLYDLESENIEYNHDHYFSGNFIKQLSNND